MPADEVTPCKHCSTNRACRPRGLCDRCYTTPGVRVLYPKGVSGPKNGHDCFGGSRLPGRPTFTLPGSPERLDVYASRAAEGVLLFHPKDANHCAR